MTLKDFLALPPEEQRLEAAKCFTPKPWKHDISTDFCPKCKKMILTQKTFETECLPKPLTLDWNTAKRLQGECDYPATFAIAMFDIYYNLGLDFDEWLLNNALPIHYIAACMRAKWYLK